MTPLCKFLDKRCARLGPSIPPVKVETTSSGYLKMVCTSIAPPGQNESGLWSRLWGRRLPLDSCCWGGIPMAQRAFHSDSHRPTSWAGNDGGKREDEGCGAWGSGARKRHCGQ